MNNDRSDRGVADSNQPVRIVFLLILDGRATTQISRLIKNIYSNRHIYYLHIDKRNQFLFDELIHLEKAHDNIILAKSRFNTIWGGTSLLRMILDSINHLGLYEWDYLINLSESDFPVKPLNELENYLDSNRELIFLKSHNIKGYNFIRKQGLDFDFYQCEDRVWKLGKRQLPRGIIYSGGSDWFALPREFCRYIANNLDNPKSLVKPLVQLYNFTLLPAESFFHTLALNTEFCDRFSDNNLRLTNWHRKQGCKCQHKNVVDWCGCSPLVYRLGDSKLLLQTNATERVYFSRKFDPTISSSLINLVEEKLVRRGLAPTEQITAAFWKKVYSNYETNNHLA